MPDDRLGGAPEAICIMKEHRNSPAGYARGGFQRAVGNLAAEYLFLNLTVVEVAGAVLIALV